MKSRCDQSIGGIRYTENVETLRERLDPSNFLLDQRAADKQFGLA